MKAVIYARFSSDKQEDRSIEDQVALCRQYAARQGFEVVAVNVDRAISGASMHGRAGLEQTIALARSGKANVILAEDMDRLSRNQHDTAWIYERMVFAGIEIWTVADGCVNEMIVGMKGMMSALFLKNLAQKTHRGLAGRVRAGKSAGGRSYGYDVQGTGDRIVNPVEAAVIRRIFSDVGERHLSARDIASRLNAEGTPGPRGGHWNASTINGSLSRANGILRNELYVGRMVWNRQRFIKDPDTGKRVSRANDATARQVAEVPHLRIVDDETWAAVQRRLAERSNPMEGRRARPKHLLSGLCKCATCGGPFIVAGSDKLGCSRRRESGICDNRRMIKRSLLEERILAAITAHLLHPDVIAAAVKEYHDQRKRLSAGIVAETRRRERRIAEISRDLERIVDVIVAGGFNDEMRQRMDALEAERAALRQKPDLRPDVVALHPTAIERYRDMAINLHKTIEKAPEHIRAEVFGNVRKLIEKIVIWPRSEEGKDIELYGTLADLLELPRRSAGGVVEVVAGTGYSRAHTPDPGSIVIPLRVARR